MLRTKYNWAIFLIQNIKKKKPLIVSKTKQMCIHYICRDKAQKPKSQGHGYIKSEVLISKYDKVNNILVLFYQEKNIKLDDAKYI